jgi:hypothetical protein
MFEEIQWQRRGGGVNWILKGDSNNNYFHNKANGRKKKSAIFALQERDKELRDPKKSGTMWENITKNCLVLKWRG